MTAFLPMPSRLLSETTLQPSRRRTLQWAGSAATAVLLSACGAPTLQQPPVSAAAVDRAYRPIAARHLYARNASRIYSGMLPTMLYAIGVLQVHLNERGQIRSLHWMRAPKHAPEVIAEIERTVRAAAPFPQVPRGGVMYTDTWLWDRSGQFQLDTLTEGQKQQ